MRFMILLFLLSEVACEFAADLFLTLKYSNRQNLLENGFPCDLWITDLNCDVYFEVCVSSNGNRGCNLLNKTTPVFVERTQVEMTNHGRIVIPLRPSLPKSLRIDVVAWDQDAISTNDLIGDFAIEGSLQYLLQGSRDLRPRKACSTKMSMQLELKCRPKWFGELCETYCSPTNNSFTCDDKGNAICLPGANCGASYNPCLNETCSEHGECKRSHISMDGFECVCARRWRGKRCELRVDACEFEENRLQELNAGETTICLNNGTCVSDPNGLDFHCQCPPDYEGSRCEKSTHQRLTIAISSSVTVFVSLIVVTVVAIVVGLKISARKRLRQNGFIYTSDGRQRSVKMSMGGKSINDDQKSMHIYAEIGDPYVLPGNYDLNTADAFAPSQSPEKRSIPDSPPAVPPRIPFEEAPPNKHVSSSTVATSELSDRSRTYRYFVTMKI